MNSAATTHSEVRARMTEQGKFSFEDAAAPLPDVQFHRDGDWYVARPRTMKPGYTIVTGSCSKISFEDAERILRRLLT